MVSSYRSVSRPREPPYSRSRYGTEDDAGSPPAEPSLLERCIQRDLHSREGLRNRATLLGGGGKLLELPRIDPRRPDARRQLHRGDLEPALDPLDRTRGL